MMELRGICKNWLELHGYSGLAGDECGCELSDLMPCDEPSPLCVAGYKHICSECKDENDCDMRADYDCKWCISTKKEADTDVG